MPDPRTTKPATTEDVFGTMRRLHREFWWISWPDPEVWVEFLFADLSRIAKPAEFDRRMCETWTETAPALSADRDRHLPKLMGREAGSPRFVAGRRTKENVWRIGIYSGMKRSQERFLRVCREAARDLRACVGAGSQPIKLRQMFEEWLQSTDEMCGGPGAGTGKRPGAGTGAPFLTTLTEYT